MLGNIINEPFEVEGKRFFFLYDISGFEVYEDGEEGHAELENAVEITYETWREFLDIQSKGNSVTIVDGKIKILETFEEKMAKVVDSPSSRMSAGRNNYVYDGTAINLNEAKIAYIFSTPVVSILGDESVRFFRGDELDALREDIIYNETNLYPSFQQKLKDITMTNLK